MDLSQALKWAIGGGVGWIASYLFKWLETRVVWLEDLEPDTKFGVVCAFTCVLAWGAWALLQLAPGAVWPMGAWEWLNALFTVGFTAITGSQAAYARNTLRARRS